MWKSLSDRWSGFLSKGKGRGGRLHGNQSGLARCVPTVERLEERMVLSGFLDLLPHEEDRPELQIRFSQDVDPVSAADVGNYRVVDPAGLDVSIDMASYDADNNTATLGINAGEALAEGEYDVFYQAGQIQMAAGDFIPGDLDFAVAVANPDAQRVAVRRGNGDGSFVTTSTLEMPDTQPGFITNGDLNGDGSPDLIVGVPWRDEVRAFFGRGDGNFDGPVILAVGDTPLDAAVRDVNGDGSPDIATANLFGSATFLLNDGTGSFPSRIDVGMPDRTNDVLVLDDGRVPISIQNVGVMIGSGLTEAGFANTTVYGVPAGGGLYVADVDVDGQTDILVAAPGLPGRSISVLYGNANGFTPVTYSVYPSSPTKLAVADVNADGLPDIIYIDPSVDTLGVLNNLGERNFAAQAPRDTLQSPTGLQTGHFNRDGLVDVMISTTNDDQRSTISLYYSGPDGLGPQQFESAGLFGPANDVTVGEFDPLTRLGSFVVAEPTGRVRLVFGSDLASQQPQIHIYDPVAQARIDSFPSGNQFMGLDYDPVGNRLFASDNLSQEPRIHIFDVTTRTEVDSFRSNTHVMGLAYDATTGLLYGSDDATQDPSIHVYDMESRAEIASFRSYAHIAGLAYDPDRRLLYGSDMAGQGPRIHLYDVATRAEIGNFPSPTQIVASSSPSMTAKSKASRPRWKSWWIQ